MKHLCSVGLRGFAKQQHSVEGEVALEVEGVGSDAGSAIPGSGLNLLSLSFLICKAGQSQPPVR